MSKLWLLAVCVCLALALPARPAAAQTLSCDVAASVGQIVPDALARLFRYTDERPVLVGSTMLWLRICAPREESVLAEDMLRLLEQALPELHEVAGVRLNGQHDRTIMLVTQADLTFPDADDLVADGMNVNGVIYLHPRSTPWTVVHEGAHYWANEFNFAEQWVIEGYADYLTEQVMAALNKPYAPQAPDPTCADQPLMLWSYVPRATVGCGYRLGATIFRELAAAVGPATFRETMLKLSEASAPITSWDLLIALEQASGQDLTDVMQQRVFPAAEAELLERRQGLWQRLRAAQAQAAALEVGLPELGARLDRFEWAAIEWTAVEQELAQLEPLLQAAGAAAERCQQLGLRCQQIWQPLPAEADARAALTTRLDQATKQLDRYAQLAPGIDRLDLEPPAPLLQPLSDLDPGVATPLLDAASSTLRAGLQLADRCAPVATPCTDYWRRDWNSGTLDAARRIIDDFNTLLTRVDAVEQACRRQRIDCRSTWQAALPTAGPAKTLGTLEAVMNLLQQAAAQEQACAGAGWSCTEGWRSAFQSGGIAQAQQQLRETGRTLEQLRSFAERLDQAEQRAPLAPLSRRLPGANRPHAYLNQARQAFHDGKLTAALDAMEQARSAQRSVEQRRPLLLSLVLTVVIIAGIALVRWSLRPIRGARQRAPHRRSADHDLLAELLAQTPAPGAPQPPPPGSPSRHQP